MGVAGSIGKATKKHLGRSTVAIVVLAQLVVLAL
jgi:hypothetical protein